MLKKHISFYLPAAIGTAVTMTTNNIEHDSMAVLCALIGDCFRIIFQTVKVQYHDLIRAFTTNELRYDLLKLLPSIASPLKRVVLASQRSI